MLLFGVFEYYAGFVRTYVIMGPSFDLAWENFMQSEYYVTGAVYRAVPTAYKNDNIIPVVELDVWAIEDRSNI